MKKTLKTVFIIGIITIICSSTVIGINIKSSEEQKTIFDNWTGEIRIEGQNETIWEGSVNFNSSEIEAENMETHEIEIHIIPYPSPLGALDEASKQGDFSYKVVYYPSWDALFVIGIKDDYQGEKTGWVYFVDYELPILGADKYELTQENDEVLWGFLYFEDWETQAHALKISINKQTVKKNEEFTVTVTNETGNAIQGAIVKIDSFTYITDENGEVTTSISDPGIYIIFAEKEPTSDDTYIRSEKISLLVKKSRYISNLKFHIFLIKKPLLKYLFYYFIN